MAAGRSPLQGGGGFRGQTPPTKEAVFGGGAEARAGGCREPKRFLTILNIIDSATFHFLNCHISLGQGPRAEMAIKV